MFFGEVGLSGDVRPVSQADNRLAEAAKLGFSRAVTPPGKRRKSRDIRITPIERLRELVDMLRPSPTNGIVDPDSSGHRHG